MHPVRRVLYAESTASVLGGIALLITAIGGAVTAIAGILRKEHPGGTTGAPTDSEVWLETLHQSELKAQEVERLARLVRDKDAVIARATDEAQDAKRDAQFFREQYEQANEERLALLREFRPGQHT